MIEKCLQEVSRGLLRSGTVANIRDQFDQVREVLVTPNYLSLKEFGYREMQHRIAIGPPGLPGI